MHDTEYYLTMQEAAEKAGISYVTMKRYVRSGRVSPQKVRYPHATGYRYLFSDLDVSHAQSYTRRFYFYYGRHSKGLCLVP